MMFDSKEDIFYDLEILKSLYTKEGLIEGLLLTGNDSSSVILLKNYLDRTDDILLTVILNHFFIDNKTNFFKNSEDTLFEILNRFQMYNERISFTQTIYTIMSQMNDKNIKSSKNSSTSTSPITSNEIKSNISFEQNNTYESLPVCFYCNRRMQHDKLDQLTQLIHNDKDSYQNVNINN
jgi:hypothetical protein